MKNLAKKLDDLIIKKSNPRVYKQMYKEKQVHCCPKCGNLFVD